MDSDAKPDRALVRFPDLNEAALRRTLRVRRAEQWLLVG